MDTDLVLFIQIRPQKQTDSDLRHCMGQCGVSPIRDLKLKSVFIYLFPFAVRVHLACLLILLLVPPLLPLAVTAATAAAPLLVLLLLLLLVPPAAGAGTRPGARPAARART